MPAVKEYDLAAIRQALPALADVIYMNNGTEGIMAEPVLVDLRNIYPPAEVARHGFVYESVGRRETTARERPGTMETELAPYTARTSALPA